MSEIPSKDKEKRSRILQAISLVMGYKKGEFSSEIPKRVKAWVDNGYSYDVIIMAIRTKSKDLVWASKNKEFSSERGKLMYMLKIIESGLNNARAKRSKMEQNEEKQSLKHHEIDISLLNQKPKFKNKSKRDLSVFIEGEM